MWKIYVYLMYTIWYSMMAGLSYLTVHALYEQRYVFAGLFAFYLFAVWLMSRPFRKTYEDILEDKG